MSAVAPGSTGTPPSSRRYRDGVGVYDRYRLGEPSVLRPGELDEPLIAAQTLSVGAPCVLWIPPSGGGDAVDAGPDEALIERARRISGTDHPSLPRFVDWGHLPVIGFAPSRPFLAWRVPRGETLRQRLERGALPLEETIELLITIGEGVQALHRRELLHGALRPATVWLAQDGSVFLFLAGLLDPERFRGCSETATLPWGAAAYLAPEQLPDALAPLPATAIGPGIDLWALGVLLHETTDGELPFYGRSFDALARSIAVGHAQPLGPAPGMMPQELERFTDKTLARDPGDRYPDVTAALADLRSLQRLFSPRLPTPAKRSVARSTSPAEEPPGWRGLTDLVAERRRRLAEEAGPALWQLLLPPAFLALLVLLVAWLLWRG